MHVFRTLVEVLSQKKTGHIMVVNKSKVKDFMQIIKPSAYEQDKFFLNDFFNDLSIIRSPTGSIFVGYDHLPILMSDCWISALPNMDVKKNTIEINGNIVHSNWELEANHVDVLFGIAPTGKRLNIQGKFLLEYGNDGKISHYTSVMNVPKLINDINPMLSLKTTFDLARQSNPYLLAINSILKSTLSEKDAVFLSLYVVNLPLSGVLDILHVSESTYKRRISNVFVCLGISNKKQLWDLIISSNLTKIFLDLASATLNKHQ